MGSTSSCALNVRDPAPPPLDAHVYVRVRNGLVMHRMAFWRDLDERTQHAVQDLADAAEGRPPDDDLRPFDGDTLVALAYDGGRLVGFSRARPLASRTWERTGATPTDAEILLLAHGAPRDNDGRLDTSGWAMSGTVVADAAHGRGIGGMLLGAVLRRIGRVPVVVEIAESNEGAQRLFTKHGFVHTRARWRDGGVGMLALLRPADSASASALAMGPPFA